MGHTGRRINGDTVFGFVMNILLVLAVGIVTYPLIYVISASFSNPLSILNGEVWLLPKGITLSSYQAVLRETRIWLGYRNTLLYTGVGTLINITMTVIGAYPLSRKDLFGRTGVILIFTFTMFFSGGLIPTYLVVQKLGMVNTMWALILPGSIAMTNLIITRTYFETSVPFELQESAFIDGCSNIGILRRIVLPLSKPILAVLVVFYGVDHWNAYFSALIYLSKSDKYPLQLILRNLLLQNTFTEMTDTGTIMADQLLKYEGMKYAVVLVSSLPVLILYPFLQRYFVKGVMIGALKG